MFASSGGKPTVDKNENQGKRSVQRMYDISGHAVSRKPELHHIRRGKSRTKIEKLEHNNVHHKIKCLVGEKASIQYFEVVNITQGRNVQLAGPQYIHSEKCLISLADAIFNHTSLQHTSPYHSLFKSTTGKGIAVTKTVGRCTFDKTKNQYHGI